MSLVGQISSRLDRNLQVIGELTKALLALRAELSGKLETLKLSPAEVEKARVTVAEFLTGLTSALNSKSATTEEYRVILDKLSQAGEQPSDWAEDFGNMSEQLHAKTPLDSQQLDKIMRVIGFLQSEAAEDVRRLRSR